MEIFFGNSVFEYRDINQQGSSLFTLGINKTQNVKEMFYYDSYGKILPKTI